MAISEQKRLFVGNLPPDIQDNELKQEFSCYGKLFPFHQIYVYIEWKKNYLFTGAVVKVEIKQKKAPDSSEVQNTFAFVTIAVNDRALEQCLQEFKQQQYRGRYLQVTVARENFLEKLKREREEAAEYKQKKVELSGKQSETIRAVLPTFSTGQSSSSESSSDDSSEDESSAKTEGKPFALKESKKFESSSHSETESESDHNEDNIILKKKSKIFLENGKVIKKYEYSYRKCSISIFRSKCFRSKLTVPFQVEGLFMLSNRNRKKSAKESWMKNRKKRTRNDSIQ